MLWIVVTCRGTRPRCSRIAQTCRWRCWVIPWGQTRLAHRRTHRSVWFPTSSRGSIVPAPLRGRSGTSTEPAICSLKRARPQDCLWNGADTPGSSVQTVDSVVTRMAILLSAAADTNLSKRPLRAPDTGTVSRSTLVPVKRSRLRWVRLGSTIQLVTDRESALLPGAARRHAAGIRYCQGRSDHHSELAFGQRWGGKSTLRAERCGTTKTWERARVTRLALVCRTGTVAVRHAHASNTTGTYVPMISSIYEDHVLECLPIPHRQRGAFGCRRRTSGTPPAVEILVPRIRRKQSVPPPWVHVASMLPRQIRSNTAAT